MKVNNERAIQVNNELKMDVDIKAHKALVKLLWQNVQK